MKPNETKRTCRCGAVFYVRPGDGRSLCMDCLLDARDAARRLHGPDAHGGNPDFVINKAMDGRGGRRRGDRGFGDRLEEGTRYWQNGEDT